MLFGALFFCLVVDVFVDIELVFSCCFCFVVGLAGV